MAKHSLGGIVRHIQKLAAVQAARSLADPELLRQFVGSNDEAAFTALVERHGPLVLGVCRRALGCPHDADDAFQATFLVLARRAASIRRSASLTSWLHGVALRVVAKLKRERARRQRRERDRASPPVCDPVADVSWAEIRAALDEELDRLPERYRSVLILCYLEGKTRDEAAGQLGLTPGALHGRLERGRKLLAGRLTKRGLTLSAGLLAAAVAEGFGRAAVSPTAVLATARAATVFAAGQPVSEMVSAGVFSLTREVLKGMVMTKLKLATAGLVCSALLMATVGITFAQVNPDEDGPANTDASGTLIRIMSAVTQDTDEQFIRRVSRDVRGTEPTATEVHFFVASKDARKRETLVDLFVQERKAKGPASLVTKKTLKGAAGASGNTETRLEAARLEYEAAKANAARAKATEALQAQAEVARRKAQIVEVARMQAQAAEVARIETVKVLEEEIARTIEQFEALGKDLEKLGAAGGTLEQSKALHDRRAEIRVRLELLRGRQILLGRTQTSTTPPSGSTPSYPYSTGTGTSSRAAATASSTVSTKAAAPNPLVARMIEQSELKDLFRLVGETRGSSQGWSTQKLEAIRLVQLSLVNRKFQAVAFNEGNTVVQTMVIDFGGSFDLEKGESVTLKLPDVTKGEIRRLVLRKVAGADVQRP